MSTSQVILKTLMSATAVARNATGYSDSCEFDGCTGSATLFIKTTAGNITVSQQCSTDNKSWSDPVDTSDNPLAVVRTGLTVTTGVYVAFTPALANYIRFKVVEANVAATAVTLKLSYRMEV